MADPIQRCPFCETVIPREALYCARCGGKLPRAQATAPGIAPRSPTPMPDRGAGSPGGAGTNGGAAATSTGAGTSAPRDSAVSSPAVTSASRDSAVSSTYSQSMSVSRIQRPARGAKIALIVLGAAVCVAAGWIVGRWQRSEPIPAVPAPAVVELGEPRVAVGADLPDPARFLEPGADGGAVAPGDRMPVRPRVGPGVSARQDPQARPNAADGGVPVASHQAQPNAADGGTSAGAGNGDGHDSASAQAPPSGGEGEGEEDSAPGGLLDTRAVIYVVRHYLPQVRACYERQLRNEPGLRGQITMRFTVGAGGRITDTSVVVNSTGSDPLATCVASNLRTWRFPEPEGGAVSFEYPFRFGSPAALPELPGATQDP